jgi:hypothetical protein
MSDWRGHGIGSYLIYFITDYVNKKYNINEIRLEDSTGVLHRNVYQRMGFDLVEFADPLGDSDEKVRIPWTADRIPIDSERRIRYTDMIQNEYTKRVMTRFTASCFEVYASK